MRRYPIPLNPPEIDLPYYLENVRDITITVIPSSKIELISMNDASTGKKGNNLVQTRPGVLSTSIFYFEYKLSSKSKFQPNEAIPIQIQIEYKKGDTGYLRTATDYIIFTPVLPPIQFTGFDVLIKYAAKLVDCALNSDKEKQTIIEKLEKIYSVVLEPAKPSDRRKYCREKYQEYMKLLKSKVRNDKQMVELNTDATTEVYHH